MKITYYREQSRQQHYRLEWDLECPDAVAQEILAGDHPDYDTLAEWAEDQDRDFYSDSDRVIEQGVDYAEGDCGVLDQ